MLAISKKISAYNFSHGNNVKYIVVHDVGAQSTAKNNVDYFAGGNRNASAHYFVDDTSIWQSVEENHGAWHCGDGHGKYGITNSNSIGIEMCLPSGTVTETTENNTLELVKYLQAKYGVDTAHVVRHYDASRKNCPAQFNLDGKWTRWNNFKSKLSNGSATKKNGWEKPGDYWFYYVNGVAVKNGWKQVGNAWYLFDVNGAMYVNSWRKVNGKWYFLQSNGATKTGGWQIINGRYYNFDSSGAMKEGWFKEGKTWYYLDNTGAMKTGWFKDKAGNWYYLSTPNGAMVTGTAAIDGKTYNFNESGVCQNP